MLWEISLFIIAIAFLLLVLFAIPSLLQIRKTAKSIELNSNTLNQSLPGILTNLDEITTNITKTTHITYQEIEKLSVAVAKVGEMVDDVVNFEKNLREEIEVPVVETLHTMTAIVKGVRAFLDAFRSKS